MIIKPPEPEHIPQLRSLWKQAFGDTDAFLDKFFSAGFAPERCRCVIDRGQVAAALYWFNCQCGGQPLAYIYAVATGKAFRGQGLCRRLMAHAEKDLKARGFACCVLTPGEPGLYAYYENLGYRTAFARRRTPFPGGKSISLEEYMLRREKLLQEPHMIYDKTVLSYAASVYGLTFYETDRGVAAASPCYTAEVLPEDLEGERVSCGMIRQLAGHASETLGYLGFALE